MRIISILWVSKFHLCTKYEKLKKKKIKFCTKKHILTDHELQELLIHQVLAEKF